jgi:transposase
MEGLVMSGRLVPDELWNEIEHLFPVHEPSPKGGRPPVGNREVFTCLMFVLKTGIGWRDLPTEMGASEKTVRRRLNEWTDSGLWAEVFEHLLTQANAKGRLDMAEVLIDGGLIKAPSGGEKSAPTQPTEVALAVS